MALNPLNSSNLEQLTSKGLKQRVTQRQFSFAFLSRDTETCIGTIHCEVFIHSSRFETYGKSPSECFHSHAYANYVPSPNWSWSNALPAVPKPLYGLSIIKVSTTSSNFRKNKRLIFSWFAFTLTINLSLSPCYLLLWPSQTPTASPLVDVCRSSNSPVPIAFCLPDVPYSTFGLSHTQTRKHFAAISFRCHGNASGQHRR